MSAEQPVRVYTPESRSLHPTLVLREIWAGFRKARYTSYRLVVRDVRNNYATAKFGMIWDMLDPLILASVFYFLRRTDVLTLGQMPISYGTYIVFGLLLYQTFMDAALQAVEVIRRERGLLAHVRVPPEVLPTSVFYRVGFTALFRMAVMAIFAIVSGDVSFYGFIAFVLLFPMFIVAGIAVGIPFAPFNAIYSDISRLFRVILVPLRYATPTIFFFPPESLFAKFNLFNPIAVMIMNLRQLATMGQSYEPGIALAHCVGIAVIGAVGLFIFHISLPVVAAKI